MWWSGRFCTARRDEPLNVPGMRSRAWLIVPRGYLIIAAGLVLVRIGKRVMVSH